MKEKTKRIFFQMDEDSIKAMEAIAKQKGITFDQAINEALKLLIKRNPSALERNDENNQN